MILHFVNKSNFLQGLSHFWSFEGQYGFSIFLFLCFLVKKKQSMCFLKTSNIYLFLFHLFADVKPPTPEKLKASTQRERFWIGLPLILFVGLVVCLIVKFCNCHPNDPPSM